MTKKSQPAVDEKWSGKVDSDSTHPPPGLFKQDAQTVADRMADEKVSPNGIGSGIQMIQFYINRAGKNLSEANRRQLEKAKQILQERLRRKRKAK